MLIASRKVPLRLFPSTCLIRQDVILQEIAVTIYFFLFIKCETSYIYYYFTFYSTAYIKAAAALCVVCLITDIAATILTGLGLRTRDHNDKYKYYRFAVYCMAIARKCHIITIFLFVSFFLSSVFYNYILLYFSGMSLDSIGNISHMFRSRIKPWYGFYN